MRQIAVGKLTCLDSLPFFLYLDGVRHVSADDKLYELSMYFFRGFIIVLRVSDSRMNCNWCNDIGREIAFHDFYDRTISPVYHVICKLSRISCAVIEVHKSFRHEERRL